MKAMQIAKILPAVLLMALALPCLAQNAKPAITTPSTAPAQAPILGNEFEPRQIIALMRSVADWSLANKNKNYPKLDMNKDADWSTATFRAGVMAIYRTTGDKRYLDNTLAWGEANQWKLRGRGNGDDSCAGQTYCEMYLLDPKPENAIRYAHAKECYDRMLFDKNFNGLRVWSWQDSLFMGTPVVSMLGKITGNNDYYDRLVTGFHDAAKELYNPEHHMWYFKPGPNFQTTKGGNPKFWGPGNAWVLGALTRDLMYMPNDYKRRGELMKYYTDLCAALVPKQQPSGFWLTSLYEPTEFPDPEASGTAFFVYGMGRGILEGWLDKATYLPVVRKGWAALATTVDADGKLHRCQQWSNQPGRVGIDMTIPEGCGAFLLAGEVVHELVQKGYLKK